MKDVTVELMMGLPGSGKTHYTKERENNRGGVRSVILDELSDIRCYGKKHSMPDLVQIGVSNVYRYANTILLDGPFFTNEHVRLALHAIAQEYGNITVIIHHWLENRDYCLKNDGGRRDVPSVHTIQNAEYEYPDIQWLNEQLSANGVTVQKVVEHEVELKPEWIRYWRPIKYQDDGKLYSMSWCTGGCWKDCWGGSTPAIPEEPYEFTELDELLEEIAPTLSYLQYKRIRRDCVDTHTYGQNDYYGGGTTHCQWTCDLEKLYEILKEYGYANV